MTETVFDSTDSNRSARPLRHVQTARLDGPHLLEKGARLDSITVAYETYGQLNAARDNAILICHAISGDSHVARHDDEDEPGWWDLLVGPGCPVDTDRFFVVCPNLLGGCRGSTGPGSTNPATGKPYGRDFPTITMGDMVDVQFRLIRHLGLDQLLAVVGGSVGGHQAMTWGVRHPGAMRGVVLLATSPRLTSQSLAFDIVGRNAILRDPHFHGGQYYHRPHGPEVGLAIARMIGHITYLSQEAMSQKFDPDRFSPRDVPVEFEKRFSVGSYLGYQGAKFVERFDANSYIALTMAMDLFDLGGTPAELAASFRPARCRWLVVGFSSDWLFPPSQSRDVVDALLANGAAVSHCNVQSSCGHDAFLLADDFPVYGEMTRGFINHLAPSTQTPAPASPPTTAPAGALLQHRLDHDCILDLVPAGARVLDLGCGSGTLIERLRRDRGCRVMGVELDERNLVACVDRGLDVVQVDLNRGLRAFSTGEFDFVILSQTLQAVSDVEGLVTEMLRVGRTVIVSIPNFAYHRLRRMLAEDGRAPKSSGVLRHEWYNTPNIRFFTIADFEDFCQAKRIQVHRRIAFDTEAGTEIIEDPNLNADLAIFTLSRAVEN